MRLKTFTSVVIGAASLFVISSFSVIQQFDLKASIARGEDVYATQCMSCHMDNGAGIEGVFPPLAKADYLMADKNRSIREVLHGLSGEIVVNGKKYNGEMPGYDLTDEEASDVLNYIRNTWGNKGVAVLPSEVRSARK